MGSRFDMLGAVDARDAESSGFDLSSLGPAASSLLNAGGQIVSAVEKDKDTKKASRADNDKLQAAIRADDRGAVARATAYVSERAVEAALEAKKASAKAKAAADRSAADLATSAASSAGAEVPASLTAKRAQAAETALTAATTRLQAEPESAYYQALQREWQRALTMAQSGQIMRNPEVTPLRDDGPWYDWFQKRTIVKAAPNAVTVAGGVTVLGLAWYAVKRGVLRRIFGG